MTIEITVYGSPAPQGSKKFVGMVNGHGMMAESSKKVKPWRQDVKAEALKVRNGEPPIDGPVVVRMVFTLPKPLSAPKRKRTYPDKKPDLSKLVRSTEDALTEAGIWRDDARVIGYQRLAKVFPNEDPEALDSPGVKITVMRIESDAQHIARAQVPIPVDA